MKWCFFMEKIYDAKGDLCMGWTSNDLLIMPILLNILLRKSSEKHPLTLDMLYERLVDYYETSSQRSSLKETISRNLDVLEHFLDTLRVCDYGIYLEGHEDNIISRGYLALTECTLTDSDNPKRHLRAYFISNRLFSNTELDIICNSIWGSAGIDYNLAIGLIRKIGLLGGKNYKASFGSIDYSLHPMSGVDRDELAYSLDKIRRAIEMKKKISLSYGMQEDRFTLSPYSIVSRCGKFYLICYRFRQRIAEYRIDRMHKVKITAEPIKEVHELEDPLAKNYSAQNYLSYHPRMMLGEPIDLYLRVHPSKMESVLEEFEISSSPVLFDGKYRVGVKTTDVHAASWLINFDESVEVDMDHQAGKKVIEKMVDRGLYILKKYAPEYLSENAM